MGEPSFQWVITKSSPSIARPLVFEQEVLDRVAIDLEAEVLILSEDLIWNGRAKFVFVPLGDRSSCPT